MLVFVSPSSRYALLDTADLPLTIRETTVDYQVHSKLACVPGVQREGEGKTRSAKRDQRGTEGFFPSDSPSDHASHFKFSPLPPLDAFHVG